MLLDLLGAAEPLIVNHFDNTAHWFDRLIAAGQQFLCPLCFINTSVKYMRLNSSTVFFVCFPKPKINQKLLGQCRTFRTMTKLMCCADCFPLKRSRDLREMQCRFCFFTVGHMLLMKCFVFNVLSVLWVNYTRNNCNALLFIVHQESKQCKKNAVKFQLFSLAC